MNNNLKSILSQILSTSGGAKAAKDLKGMDMSDIERKISSMNKEEVVSKLNAMNLSPIAEKVKSMSNQEIAALLKANPQFIDLLNKL